MPHLRFKITDAGSINIFQPFFTGRSLDANGFAHSKIPRELSDIEEFAIRYTQVFTPF